MTYFSSLYQYVGHMYIKTELGTSLFALERNLILGAMALLETKSEAQWVNWQNQILSGRLMSDLRIKECHTNGWKRHKNARFIHILIKIPARLAPIMYRTYNRYLLKMQSWAHRSLKSLFRSSLLSEPWFWERCRSLRQRAKRSERTEKTALWAVRSWAI